MNVLEMTILLVDVRSWKNLKQNIICLQNSMHFVGFFGKQSKNEIFINFAYAWDLIKTMFQ
jgi:hypothetical protein